MLRGVLGALAMVGFAAEAAAETRCEPTMSKPCPALPTKAVPSTPVTTRPPPQPIEDAPLFPQAKLDADTTVGFGVGGIFGLKHEF